MKSYLNFLAVFITSFSVLAQGQARPTTQASSCDVHYLKSEYRSLNLIKGEYESMKNLALAFADLNKEATRDMKISSALAITSGTLMLGGNFLFTRTLLAGGTKAAAMSGALSSPIRLQIWAIRQIGNIVKSPLSLIGAEGLKALAGVVAITGVGADKAYAISKGVLNITYNNKSVQIKLDAILKSEQEYREAITMIHQYRNSYIDEGPTPLENGLSFGRKAVDYTQNLEVLASYEAQLINDLYTMKRAKYIIERTQCDKI